MKLKHLAAIGLLWMVSGGVTLTLAEEFAIGFEETEGYSVTGGDAFGNGNLIGQPSKGNRPWRGSQGWGKSGCSTIRVVKEDGQKAQLFLADMPPVFPIYFMEVPSSAFEPTKIKFTFRIKYEDDVTTGAQRDSLLRIGLDSDTSGKANLVRLEFLGNRRLFCSNGEGKSSILEIGGKEWIAASQRWLDFVLTLYPERGTYTLSINNREMRQADGSDWKLPESTRSVHDLYIAVRGLRSADRVPPVVSIDDLTIGTP